MNLKKLALLALIGLLAGLYIHFDLGQYLSLQSLKNQQAAIEAFRASNPLLSVAGYFVVYVIVTALSFPGAALGHRDCFLCLNDRRHPRLPDVAFSPTRLGEQAFRAASGSH